MGGATIISAAISTVSRSRMFWIYKAQPLPDLIHPAVANVA
jgi:hypothetical protein